MNRKKLGALLIAGLLTVGIAGGTLAWFTSQDSVTNTFNTGTTDTTNPNAGIKINENFPGDTNGDKVYDGPITPNQTVVKEVTVENTANYNQIIRAHVVKNFIDITTEKVVTHWATNSEGKIVYGDSTLSGGKALDLSYIILADNLNGTGLPEGWVIQESATVDTSKADTTNWYYYSKVATPSEVTTKLLKAVTLSSAAGNEYKNLRFDVKVEAESIQAANGAINDNSVWQNVPESIKSLNQ